jgi:thiamine pyrophosphate-dependent acetolactate synthase large subunit-like protein
MRNAALVCFLILIPCSLRAQEKKDEWKALYGLRSGEKIELIETGMKKHVGNFSTVTEEAIQLREGSNDIGIRKESVARVTLLEKSHRGRNALILGAVGAGAGAGIGAAASRCSNSNTSFNFCGLGRGVEVAIGAVVGLVGGAGIGAAIPSHPTIYRAEPAKSSAPR